MMNTAAHRDGSPYPLRMGHKVAPKEVGRTVSVSRRGKQLFRVFSVFRGQKLEVTGRIFCRSLRQQQIHQFGTLEVAKRALERSSLIKGFNGIRCVAGLPD